MAYDRCFALIEIGIEPGDGNMLERVKDVLQPNPENILGVRLVHAAFDGYWRDDSINPTGIVLFNERAIERGWRVASHYDEHGSDNPTVVYGSVDQLVEVHRSQMEAGGWEFLEERELDDETGFELIFQREWGDNTSEDVEGEETHQICRTTFLAQD